MATILGDSALSEMDKIYAKFSTAFEDKYLNQGFYESRSIEDTMDIGWELLRILPKSELRRVDQEYIDQYYDEGNR